ncbi:hypothetical protein C8E08_3413 [Paracidovorax citrulli]|uniref:Uncharacterized protein n=1 Tax=Paracidovorax citrulli (strain AAC00-1) TaxID=397945 RepID=A1TLJ7_PARC0|nr:hypothetical protein Aave_1244 [Paracidovorax citrulli AAC00-1]ATG95102.1 hypothetical protein CQB05_14610 [Paracidovorax citrulli]PVY66024.1 hypothetical protein C8E08_3413 [Paracidovorax citrulli]REG69803.1 hypothetical protein C8E07_2972 [Paracidovorax citrulli]RLJ94357.1 hypothetical protein C8E06_2971 [Paracidovorax citrulli]
MGNQCIGGSSSASRSSRRAASHHAPAESSARTGRGSSSQPSGGGALGGLRRRSAQPQQTAAQLQRAYDEVTDLLNRTASNPAFRTQQQQLHSLQGEIAIALPLGEQVDGLDTRLNELRQQLQGTQPFTEPEVVYQTPRQAASAQPSWNDISIPDDIRSDDGSDSDASGHMSPTYQFSDWR